VKKDDEKERIYMDVNRRQFLTYLGAGTAALASMATGIPALAAGSTLSGKTADHLFGLDQKKHNFNPKFKEIHPTSKDDVVLPDGFKYDVIASYGDKINAEGDTFGFNNDFTCFLPIEGKSDHGLLWVNHEYLGELEYYVNGYNYIQADPDDNKRTPDQIQKYLYALGGSVIEIKKQDGTWKLVSDSKYGRRVSGLTKHVLTGPAASIAKEVTGTFANCSGGVTFWNTVLSCEENYLDVVGDCKLPDDKHYGWVIEVDPFDPKSTPKKHTALGRFSHENTAMVLAPTGQLVVYMGDDAKDQYVYKYVSKAKFDPKAGKNNSKLLEEGTLYVANFGKGKWISLDYTTSEALQKAVNGEGKPLFASQADVLINCREASKAVGATPMDRPEDLEVHPIDGSGNLWVVTDISSSSANSGIYKSFGNNGVFFIPTTGNSKGVASQFASGPVGAEMTGPWFTPDEKTLFLAVQHPGENLKSYDQPTSHWPKGGNAPAMPSVIAITGF
jgi:secreted PhoX family phosphatase